MWFILLPTFIGLLMFLWIRGTSKPPNFPPGPDRLPILGSVRAMKNPWQSKPSIFWAVVKCKEKYGDIFSMYLGNLRTVIFTNYDDCKEVFNMEESIGRPPTKPVDIRPGWEIPQELDPLVNKDRQPGVILSSVSFCFCIYCIFSAS